MGQRSLPEAGRGLCAAALSCTVAVTLAQPVPGAIGAALAPHAAVDTVVLAGVLTLAALAAAALATGCTALTLTALARATGRRAAALDRTARALTPAALRRVVAAGVGVGLGLGGTVTATATETDLGWQPTATSASTTTAVAATPPATSVGRAAEEPSPASPPTAVDGPREPTAASGAATAPPAASVATATITVRPGDTLWSLAAAGLVDPTDARIAAAWPRWHEANREVIGPDPDVLLPGQVLTVPGPAASQPESHEAGAAAGSTR